MDKRQRNIQAPTSKHQRNFKLQALKQGTGALWNLETRCFNAAWNFVISASMEFGAWLLVRLMWLGIWILVLQLVLL
jgi:hypothetical protein